MSIMCRCAGALYLDSGIFFESGVSEHFRFEGIRVAYKRSSDEIFIKGTIKTVAEIGIENMRTKHVADYAGFTEATHVPEIFLQGDPSARGVPIYR